MMKPKTRTWTTVGLTVAALATYFIVGCVLHFSELRRDIYQLQTQLSERDARLMVREQEIAKKNAENSSQQQELDRRLEEVKHLQGSIKTVSRCLLGTSGLINSIDRNDEQQAKQSMILMKSTCQDAGEIIKQIENYQS